MTDRLVNTCGAILIGLLVILAAGGAARSPQGIVLGLAGLPALGLALVVALILVARAVDRRAILGLAVIPLLLVLAPRSAAAGALSGPVLSAVVAAALMLIRPPWLRLRPLFVPVVLSLYIAVSLGVQSAVGPQGDEPHYLMVAESLIRDHDLSLEQDYREARYRAFFKGDTLLPHFRVRGRHGEIYSLHAIGLSLLVLPAYFVAGYRGASIFMALLAVLAAIAVRSLLRATAEDDEAAEAFAWIVAISPPLVHFAGLIFTEVPAALVVAFALREGLRARETSMARAAAVAISIAFLPWLNVRYAIVAGFLWLFWAWMRPRRAVLWAHVSAAAASATALLLYHDWLYGFFDPRRVYGKQREFSLPTLGWGAPGLLLDQEFGLLAYAPVFILAIPGFIGLARRRSKVGLVCAALVLVVFTTAAAWPMWRGGFNPPARFLVPVVPALALGAVAWVRERRSAATALLVGWGVFTGLAGAIDPSLVHRDRDGTAPLFRADSGATEWTRLLPRYVLFEPDRHRLALVWSGVLLLALLRSRKPVRPASIACGLVVLAGAAELAARLSDARVGGREAVHLVGQTAFMVPGWRVSDQTAVWTPGDLSWGPVYEPYRHSGNAVVGDRLRLREGSYRLDIEGEGLGGAGPAPSLRRLGREGRPIGEGPCRAEAGAWVCPFGVAAGSPETTLVLVGGSPFTVREIRLAFNPLGGGPV